MNTNTPHYILGAADPEMQEIEKIIKQTGLPYIYATDLTGIRVSSKSAYSCSLSIPDAPVYLVECRPHLDASANILAAFDHHNEGDSGYAKAPHEYLAGSSLGQILTHLNKEPTKEQKIICATDHCLAAAYAGHCPDVDPQEALWHRLSSKATRYGISTEQYYREFEQAKQLIENNEMEGIAYFIGKPYSPLVPEASAYLGIPVVYRSDNQEKEMIKGGTPEQIKQFLSYHANLGRSVYGNPHRGYAGVYLKN